MGFYLVRILTFIMLKNGQTYFKVLVVIKPEDFPNKFSDISALCMEGLSNWKEEYLVGAYLEHCQTSLMNFFAKMINCFLKNHHHRCLVEDLSALLFA